MLRSLTALRMRAAPLARNLQRAGHALTLRDLDRTRAAELLGVTERGGIEAAHRWLDALGVHWLRPTGLTEHFGRTST